MRRSLIVVALAASTASCSLLTPAWNADVAIVSIAIREVELLQTTAIFTVRIDNAEPIPLLLDGSVHEIEIDGWEVGRGLNPDYVEIPRLSSREIQVEVHIDNVSAVRRLADIVDGGRFHYRVKTVLHVVRGNRSQEARLEHDGFVDFSRGAPPGD